MLLKIKCYLSAYNKYCQIMWKEDITRKLIIGNQFIVSYLSKRLGYFETVKSETETREPGTYSLFLILVYNTDV